jgi:8-oxo-dGTP pyrophosphatase MutT (NUDIX family)
MVRPMDTPVENPALPFGPDLPSRFVETLGTAPLDYVERFAAIRAGRSEGAQAAGVLLLLRLEEGVPFLQLIKRSATVAQPGDLSCPGGMLHGAADVAFRSLLCSGSMPVIRGRPRELSRLRGGSSYRMICLFLANALREAWEEVGLNPLRVRFLGPLPTYSLILFRRTIFPLAGVVTAPWTVRPSREVERVVEIPLAAFFAEESYGRYVVTYTEVSGSAEELCQDFPCLIHRDPDGTEEILWGATFYIIMRMLKIVFDFDLPDWTRGRPIQRSLRADYLTGRRR